MITYCTTAGLHSIRGEYEFDESDQPQSSRPLSGGFLQSMFDPITTEENYDSLPDVHDVTETQIMEPDHDVSADLPFQANKYIIYNHPNLPLK